MVNRYNYNALYSACATLSLLNGYAPAAYYYVGLSNPASLKRLNRYFRYLNPAARRVLLNGSVNATAAFIKGSATATLASYALDRVYSAIGGAYNLAS